MIKNELIFNIRQVSVEQFTDGTQISLLPVSKITENCCAFSSSPIPIWPKYKDYKKRISFKKVFFTSTACKIFTNEPWNVIYIMEVLQICVAFGWWTVVIIPIRWNVTRTGIITLNFIKSIAEQWWWLTLMFVVPMDFRKWNSKNENCCFKRETNKHSRREGVLPYKTVALTWWKTFAEYTNNYLK